MSPRSDGGAHDRDKRQGERIEKGPEPLSIAAGKRERSSTEHRQMTGEVNYKEQVSAISISEPENSHIMENPIPFDYHFGILAHIYQLFSDTHFLFQAL